MAFHVGFPNVNSIFHRWDYFRKIHCESG